MPSWKEWYDLLLWFKVFWEGPGVLFHPAELPCLISRGFCLTKPMVWTGPGIPSCLLGFSPQRLSFPAGIARCDSLISFSLCRWHFFLAGLKSAVDFCDIQSFDSLIRVQALAAVLRCSDCFMPRMLQGHSWNSRRKLTTATHLLFPRSLLSLMLLRLFPHVRPNYFFNLTPPAFQSHSAASLPNCRFHQQTNAQGETWGPRCPGCSGWLNSPAENTG